MSDDDPFARPWSRNEESGRKPPSKQFLENLARSSYERRREFQVIWRGHNWSKDNTPDIEQFKEGQER